MLSRLTIHVLYCYSFYQSLEKITVEICLSRKSEAALANTVVAIGGGALGASGPLEAYSVTQNSVKIHRNISFLQKTIGKIAVGTASSHDRCRTPLPKFTLNDLLDPHFGYTTVGQAILRATTRQEAQLSLG